MVETSKAFSVAECAAICGVGRGTIHYWIKTEKLRVSRSGKSYRIPADDLLCFLRATRRPVPKILEQDATERPLFGAQTACWKYGHNDDLASCRECLVYARKMDTCFSAKATGRINCPEPCHQCRYYLDVLFPRIHFIHQIDTPAAIYQDLYFIGANRKFAEICGIDASELPGLGIEQVIHPDSLGQVIANARIRSLGDEQAPRTYPVFVATRHQGRIKARITVYPLKEPKESYLVLGEVTNGHESPFAEGMASGEAKPH